MLVLSVLFTAVLACSGFSQEFQDRLRKEATQTTQASSVTPDAATQSSPQPDVVETGAVPIENQTCSWRFVDATEAIATGGGNPGMSSESSPTGGSITTSYVHAGNFQCSDQIFKTTHDWEVPPEVLIPGRDFEFSVSLSWELDGTPECTSLTAGASTYLAVGSATIANTEQGTINLSSEPDGLLFSSGPWVILTGSAGDSMQIKAHGSSGSLGGTITYNYTYECTGSP
jgi:hypothetical protein